MNDLNKAEMLLKGDMDKYRKNIAACGMDKLNGPLKPQWERFLKRCREDLLNWIRICDIEGLEFAPADGKERDLFLERCEEILKRESETVDKLFSIAFSDRDLEQAYVYMLMWNDFTINAYMSYEAYAPYWLKNCQIRDGFHYSFLTGAVWNADRKEWVYPQDSKTSKYSVLFPPTKELIDAALDEMGDMRKKYGYLVS